VEKFLVYQNSEKYTKISVKYNNQIVTTLNPQIKENDSILDISKKEYQKVSEVKTLKTNIQKQNPKAGEEKKKTK
jgi:cell division protein FtsQ